MTEHIAPVVPVDPMAPPGPTQPGEPDPEGTDGLNWSNLKQMIPGHVQEDVEVHLLHCNNWMNLYHFSEAVKYQ